jgi:CubicO group peptidase (beta-lactamase class C family)
MKKNSHSLIRLVTFSFLILYCLPVISQIITSNEIDSLVEKTLAAFNVPGIAVAVVKDGSVIHAKGYGVRSLSTKQKVDENTLFGIASNSKAFTSAALGILVEEKKLNWGDKVIDYIPEFRLYNPYVTEEFTIRDLLTHRSGLGLGAGDLMAFPALNYFTINDIIHNIRYLKPVSSFRAKFDYDNLMYIVAGEVVSRVSKMTWEDFVETRIMKSLNMTVSAAAYSRLKDKSNVVDPHIPYDGVVQVADRSFHFNEAGNAAAGIYSNITDMSKWIIMHLNDGKYGEGLKKQLFSKAVHEQMWSPQTIILISDTSEYHIHFSSYGLGWFLRDVRGYKQVYHTGGVGGIKTQVTMMPELKLGIIVLTNQMSSNAYKAITNTILDSYFGMHGIDWIKKYSAAEKKDNDEAKKIYDNLWKDIDLQQKSLSGKIDYDLFTGTYTDKWFGDAIISVKNGKLWFDSKKSPKFTGELLAYKGNTFVVRWEEKIMSASADAYVTFFTDITGKAKEIKMKALYPFTDFSFDFQDLDFIR